MAEIIIYHNNRCGKSRCALSLLQEHAFEPRIRYYLDNPPTEKELQILLHQLGMKAEDLVRKNEPLFKEKYKGKTLSEKEWVRVLARNPILIERPIIIRDGKAIIARPPEKVLELIEPYTQPRQ